MGVIKKLFDALSGKPSGTWCDHCQTYTSTTVVVGKLRGVKYCCSTCGRKKTESKNENS